MTKFYVILTIILLGVLGSIFYITQGNSIKNSLTPNGVPTPPFNDTKSYLEQPLGQQQQVQTSQADQTTQQTAAQPTYGVEEGLKASYSATIKTSRGDITLTLFSQQAPNTVKNFLKKAKNGYYNNLSFHRVEDWVIQGGDPKGNGTGGGLMQTELNHLPFTAGSLGLARGGDIRVSNDSQFFITKSDASWLNEQYTNFGQVTEGMDIVNKVKVGDKILGITIEE